MKLTLSAAVAAAAFLVAADAAAQSKEPIRLPYASAFSGPFVDFGERMWKEGALPALKIINDQGGINGRPLEFYKMDTRFPDTSQFLADFRRVCDDKGTPMIFGIGATKATIAVYEDLKRCGLPILNPSSAGAWGPPDFGGWIFRYQPDAAQVVPLLVKKAHGKFGFKNVALSHTNDDDATVTNIRIVRKTLDEIGVKVSSDQSFKNKETNFASQVAAHRQSNPDAVWMSHQPGDAGTFLLQLRERGLNVQAMTDGIIGSVDFWKLSQGKAAGAVGYALYAADDPRPVVQNWIKQWRQMTNQSDKVPDVFVTATYDAVIILGQVLRSVKDINNRQEIRDAFTKLRDLDTISGKVSWPKDGDAVRSEPIFVQLDPNGILKKWN
ncbi:MAG: amino acid ABC transporter substrate-binding protein [Alphaproteobacteria bacterium]|nr:amino acid ABC transporter substrate-binding protein [Alphaproteobacteria bacterium]